MFHISPYFALLTYPKKKDRNLFDIEKFCTKPYPTLPFSCSPFHSLSFNSSLLPAQPTVSLYAHTLCKHSANESAYNFHAYTKVKDIERERESEGMIKNPPLKLSMQNRNRYENFSNKYEKIMCVYDAVAWSSSTISISALLRVYGLNVEHGCRICLSCVICVNAGCWRCWFRPGWDFAIFEK